MKTGTWMALAAFGCALAAATLLAFVPTSSSLHKSSRVEVPVGTGQVVRDVHPSQGVQTTRQRTLVESEGWGKVAFVTLPPLIVGGLALAGRGRTSILVRAVAAVFMWIWVFVGALSFGLLYVPSALLLTAAAVRGRAVKA